MNRKVIIFLTVLAFILTGLFIYIDRVVIQKNFKVFMIESLKASTGKNVVIHSVRFNIFKGIVLRDLIISEGNTAIINCKEVSCSILILPLFKKQVIIPSIKFRSPEIFVERRSPDKSINIIELFSKTRTSGAKLNFIVRKISITGASVNFHDNNFSPAFTRKIDGLDAAIYIALPAKLRFNMTFGIADDRQMKIKTAGEYDIPSGELKIDTGVKDLSFIQLGPYLTSRDFSIGEGRCDTDINIISGKDGLKASVIATTRSLMCAKGNIKLKIDSDVKASAKYDFQNGQFTCAGDLHSRDSELSGIEGVDKVGKIKGDFKFDNEGVTSENITAEIFGHPVKSKFALKDFSSPSSKVDIFTNVDLPDLQGLLKDKFSISLPASLEGKGRLYVNLEYANLENASGSLGGFLDLEGARIILDKKGSALEDVSGRFNFTKNQLVWRDLELKYADTFYQTSGMLTNFDSPGIQMNLTSDDLSLEAVFGISDKLITFSRLSGDYLESDFFVSGDMYLIDGTSPRWRLKGVADIDLKDLKKPFKQFKEKSEKMRLSGKVHAEFAIDGNMKDLSSCAIDARLSSADLAFYGFRASEVYLNYRQKDGAADISSARSILYGGTMRASGRIDLVSKGSPYSLSVDIANMKIESLKKDTSFKDKDISGSINANLKTAGNWDDVSTMSGSGRINITNGNLWQLNLFQGLGVLIFTSDFSNIVFREGSCDFAIENKEFFTDELVLKSDLLDLYGPVRIDFDSNIRADLKAEIRDDAMLSNARKNITTAINKYSFISIKGPLKDPKYYLKPDVGGIVEDIAGRVFQQ